MHVGGGKLGVQAELDHKDANIMLLKKKTQELAEQIDYMQQSEGKLQAQLSLKDQEISKMSQIVQMQKQKVAESDTDGLWKTQINDLQQLNSWKWISSKT